jgi:hypothetical protein
MSVSARRLIYPDNNSTSLLLLFEDITQSVMITKRKIFCSPKRGTG